MICRKCGAKLEADDRFCPSCNSPVDSRELPEEKQQEETAEEVQAGKELMEAEEKPDGKEASGVSIDLIMEKPKNSDKAPFIVMGVIGAAILAAVVFLILNLTGIGSPETYVKKAFINTIEELARKNEYTEAVEALRKEGLVSEKIGLTVNDMYMEEDGFRMSLPIPETCLPVRFALNTRVDHADSKMQAVLSAGMGNMNDICLEIFTGKEGLLIGLPDLYDNYLGMDVDILSEMSEGELDLEETLASDSSYQAAEELKKTLVQWMTSAYSRVSCEKKEKSVINAGNREIYAQEYILTMSGADFQKYMRKLPKMIEENTIFMDWISELYSERDAQEFIDDLETLMEEVIPKASVKRVVLGYVYISDKKVIQMKMPVNLEEPDSGRMITVSLLGKENIADDIRISADAYAGEEFLMDCTVLREGNKETFNLELVLDGAAMNLSMEGTYEIADNRCSYMISGARLTAESVDVTDRKSVFDCGFSFRCEVEKTDDIRMPDWENAIKFQNLTDEEAQEIIAAILDNAVHGGYIPGEYMSDIEELLEYYQMYGVEDDYGTGNGSMGDDASGSLDGSENLTYEEFAAMVKETYGDLYSDEDLKILYDSIYGNGAEYDTTGIVYGPNGQPYLFCWEEDLIIELQPVEGFVFSEDYSDAYTVEYEKAIGESDLIVMSYSIVTESMEEYIENEVESQRQYYEGVGYKLEVSGLQRGVINTHSACWVEYCATDDAGNKSQGIIAYARLDDEHGCALDMYNLFGEGEVTVDLLYECFDLYYIEN